MFLILTAILVIILIYHKLKPYTYWTDRGVKQEKPFYLLGDSVGGMLRRKSFWDSLQNLYTEYPDERYIGMYQMRTPTLILRDPDLIKQITTKDFDHFADHRSFVPGGADELWSRNLLALKGNRWRDMRSTLSPCFTSSKMRIIFNLVSECAADFTEYFVASSKGVQTVELKDIFTKYTNDVIANVVFGIKCDTLREPDNEFYAMGKKATDFRGFWKSVKFVIFMLSSKLFKSTGLSFADKDVSDFFKRIVRENIALREEKGIVRPDVLHLLMEARKGRSNIDEKKDSIDAGFATVEEPDITPTTTTHKAVKEEITDVDITAQALIFFFGGFDTVSTLMCSVGYELTVNPEIQRQLQLEVDETLKECNGTLTYESLLKMTYLDTVISETLRKWPPTVIMDRQCTKPYTIRPTKPTERPVRLEKGDLVWVLINALHYDPQYFPRPAIFDPDRFNDENKASIKPYTYLPFGTGPRNCIGSRFALIETKAIFFHLLSKFDLVPVEKTPTASKTSEKMRNLLSKEGFWIGLKLRASDS